MKSTMSYKVVSKSNKETKRIDAIADYIRKNFASKGKRLGVPNFTKEFGKYNDDKETLFASSVPTLTEIHTACRKVATAILNDKSNSVIPCVMCRNGISTIETVDATDDNLNLYFPQGKATVRKEISATEFVINYINKHKDEIDVVAVSTVLSTLAD